MAEHLSSMHETLGQSPPPQHLHLSMVYPHLPSLPSTLYLSSEKEKVKTRKREPYLLSFGEKEMPRVSKCSVSKQHLEERQGLE